MYASSWLNLIQVAVTSEGRVCVAALCSISGLDGIVQMLVHRKKIVTGSFTIDQDLSGEKCWLIRISVYYTPSS